MQFCGPCCEQALTEFSVVLFVLLWIQRHKVTAMGPQERRFSSQNHTARAQRDISSPSQPGICAPCVHGPHCTSSSISHVLVHPYKPPSSCFFQDWLSSSSWQKQLKETFKCSSTPIVPSAKQAGNVCQNLQQPRFIFETAFSLSRKLYLQMTRRGPPKLQLCYGSEKTSRTLYFFPTHKFPWKGSPNAARWVVGWLSHGEETSYPMSQMNIKKSKSCAKHDWISVRVLKSNPSNKCYTSE